MGIEPTEAAAQPPPPGLKPGVITRQHSPPRRIAYFREWAVSCPDMARISLFYIVPRTSLAFRLIRVRAFSTFFGGHPSISAAPVPEPV